MTLSNSKGYIGIFIFLCYLFISSPASSQIIYFITDTRDDQIYKVVYIGEQWWMAQNLNFGTRIDADHAQKDNSIIEKYCYDNNEEHCAVFGGLYRYNEMMQYDHYGGIGVCPTDWHIPNDAEWKRLEMNLGMNPGAADSLDWRGNNEGGKLKTAEPSPWQEPNACATDEVGFSLQPSGFITNEGNFSDEGYGAFFYCADMNVNSLPWLRWFSADECRIYRNDAVNSFGHSVRCLKDTTFILERGLLTDYRDGKEYQTVLIGNHWWMAENLNHGTWIDLIGKQTDDDNIQKFCYNNRGEYCDTFGGLYQWEEMMNYNSMSNQGICPEGWHIPSDNDWKELEFAAGMIADDLDKIGWERGTNQGIFLQGGGGSGFEALPGGMIDPDHNSVQADTNAYFWTSDQVDAKYSWSRVFQSGLPNIYRNNRSNQYDALSVRCVSNKNEILTLHMEADDTVCAGQEFMLKAHVSGGTAAKSYTWTSDPPGLYPTDSIIFVQAQTDTKYRIRVIDGYVYARDSFMVRVKPSPVFTITGRNKVCAGEENIEYVVAENPDYIYHWSPATGEITSDNGNRITVNWGSSPGNTIISVQVTDTTNGCADRKAYDVEVLPVPVFTITGRNKVCAGEENIDYAVANDPDYIYHWSTTSGEIPVNNGNMAMVNWGSTPGNTAISLQVTDKIDGCADLKAYEVEILQVPSKPFIIRKGQNLLICPDSGRFYQWYQNDEAIPAANKQFYYAKGNKSGSFRVETKRENLCTSISEPYSFSAKSTGEAGDDLQTVFIRPNPASENIIMDIINDYTGQVNVIITSSIGTIVSQHILHKQSQVFEAGIDLGGLAEGIYLVVIEYGTDKEIHRLVIQQ